MEILFIQLSDDVSSSMKKMTHMTGYIWTYVAKMAMIAG